MKYRYQGTHPISITDKTTGLRITLAPGQTADIDISEYSYLGVFAPVIETSPPRAESSKSDELPKKNEEEIPKLLETEDLPESTESETEKLPEPAEFRTVDRDGLKRECRKRGLKFSGNPSRDTLIKILVEGK